MSAYNVRVYNYKDGQQIRIYSNCYNVDNPMDVFVDNEQNISNDVKIDIESVDSTEIWNNIEEYETLLPEMVEEWQKIANDKRSKYVSLNRTINKIYEIARSNYWHYFITLTFDPKKVDSFDYDVVVKKLSKWLDNFKQRYAPDLKYIVVPELHKSGRYHFHGLFADVGCIEFVDSGKRLKDGSTIYNIGNYSLGFSTATIIKDMGRVSSYISKYITKELISVTMNKKRYWCSRNLEKTVIQEYIFSADEIQTILDDISESIKYCKTVSNDVLGITTKYIEVDY